jgi:hypothetical protein
MHHKSLEASQSILDAVTIVDALDPNLDSAESSRYPLFAPKLARHISVGQCRNPYQSALPDSVSKPARSSQHLSQSEIGGDNAFPTSIPTNSSFRLARLSEPRQQFVVLANTIYSSFWFSPRFACLSSNAALEEQRLNYAKYRAGGSKYSDSLIALAGDCKFDNSPVFSRSRLCGGLS